MELNHAIIRLTTSFSEVPGLMAGVEQLHVQGIQVSCVLRLFLTTHVDRSGDMYSQIIISCSRKDG